MILTESIERQGVKNQMKKALLINTIIVVAFILFEPLYNFCSEWADTYSLGAEMVLGLLIPIVFAFFVLATLCSIVYSVIKCFHTKDMKLLIPIIVFVVGVIIYILISDSNSFWIKLINYYLNK